jgi:hypothetical protein
LSEEITPEQIAALLTKKIRGDLGWSLNDFNRPLSVPKEKLVWSCRSEARTSFPSLLGAQRPGARGRIASRPFVLRQVLALSRHALDENAFGGKADMAFCVANVR